MFFHLKYKVGHVTTTWGIANTCFPIQNMNLSICLRPGYLQVPIFNIKYKTEDIVETWLVAVAAINI